MEMTLASLSGLKPSQYRSVMKLKWNKKLLQPLFTKLTKTNKHRIYIPFGKLAMPKHIPTPPDIETYLANHDVMVEDYVQGIGRDKHNRLVRIGKYLARSEDKKLKSLFDNDIRRTGSGKTLNDLVVVISRHPYDVAGMSTGRGWVSCMNLVDGQFKDIVPEEIKVGTMIAYLLRTDDKNINRPVARCLLKPFFSKENEGQTFYGVDNVYPHGIPKFREFLVKWVNQNINPNKAVLARINNHSYKDGRSEIAVGLDTEEGKERLLNDRNYRHAAVKDQPDILLKLPTNAMLDSIGAAIDVMDDDTAHDLAQTGKLSLLSDSIRERFLARFPVHLQKVFEYRDPNELLQIVARNDEAVLYMDYFVENLSGLERRGFLNSVAINIASDRAIKHFVSKYDNDVDISWILDRGLRISNPSILRELGAFGSVSGVLDGVRSIGIKKLLDLGFRKQIMDIHKEDPYELTDAIDASPTAAMLKQGQMQRLYETLPVEFVLSDLSILKNLISYDAGYVNLLSTHVTTDSKVAASIDKSLVELAERDADVYARIFFSTNTALKDRALRFYESVGYDKASVSPYWTSLPIPVQAESIKNDAPIPEVASQPRFRIDRDDWVYIFFYLNEIGIDVSDLDANISGSWKKFIALNGGFECVSAMHWLSQNIEAIREVPKNRVNVDAYREALFDIHTNVPESLTKFDLDRAYQIIIDHVRE